LRKITDKTVIYSMNIPVDLNNPIKISPENLAKMAPSNKENIAFKISVYGVPNRDAYQKERFNIFLKTRDLTGVPLYIGEWNNVVRTKDGGIFKLNPGLSELTKTNAGQILGAFKKAGVWGTAFWKWDYRDADTASFNLVNSNLKPTKYFGILKDAVETIYGSSSLAENSNEPTPLRNAPQVGLDAASSNTNNGTNGSSTSDVKLTSNGTSNSGGTSTSDVKLTSNGTSSSDDATTANTLTSSNDSLAPSNQENTQSSSSQDNNANTQSSSSQDNNANTQSSSSQDNNNLPSNANTNNPENYNDFNDLVHDIKNRVVVDKDISLNAFQDSGAYQGADKETQDCIDLAGKIGHSLTDREIVHCSEDPKYFQNQISNTNNNINNNNNNNAGDTGN
jgi:hypothetical protein